MANEKSDRELLELAAKAAGLQVEWVRNPAYIQERWEAHIPCGWVGQPSTREWNPLREPGDALDLAVKLHIPVSFPFKDDVAQTPGTSVVTWCRNEAHEEFFREYEGNPYAATRRAIVRAAAAIGEQA